MCPSTFHVGLFAFADTFTRRLGQLEVFGKRTSRNDIGTCPAIRGGWPAFTPWYIVDKVEYVARLKELGSAYREVMGRNFQAMTCVEVVGLVEDCAQVEIEVTAVVPD